MVGAVVVTFTDIVGTVGGSRGNGPCSEVMGSNVAAFSLISGSAGARSEGWSTSIGTWVAGPQVFLLSDCGVGACSGSCSKSKSAGLRHSTLLDWLAMQ